MTGKKNHYNKTRLLQLGFLTPTSEKKPDFTIVENDQSLRTSSKVWS